MVSVEECLKEIIIELHGIKNELHEIQQQKISKLNDNELEKLHWNTKKEMHKRLYEK